MTRTFRAPIAMLVALALGLAMALTAGAATTARSATAAPMAQTAVVGDGGVVATNPRGTMKSTIEGTTAKGQKVTGTFIPLKFKKKNGKVKVRGLINGVIHKANGEERTFSAMRTLRVKSVNGVPARSVADARAAATCDILNLVLGPLDLDLLGLKVHLDQVVLDITAESGQGKLLGNLLCGVAGLLDGGLGGVLGQVTNLLNRLLRILNLGL